MSGLLTAIGAALTIYVFAFGSVGVVVCFPFAVRWAYREYRYRRNERRRGVPRLEMAPLSREHQKAWGELAEQLRIKDKAQGGQR